MGPGPKGREEPDPDRVDWRSLTPASMGPGPKGREELHSPGQGVHDDERFNGARP